MPLWRKLIQMQTDGGTIEKFQRVSHLFLLPLRQIELAGSSDRSRLFRSCEGKSWCWLSLRKASNSGAKAPADFASVLVSLS